MESSEATESNERKWTVLSPIQRRVAGVLIEKAKTTPDIYPMTLKAVCTACNQKSNRFPVMALEPEEVEETLESLRELGAVTRIEGYGRSEKFRHLLYDWLGVEKVELSVMGELLLRGAQTEGELRGRASRMDQIADLPALRPPSRKPQGEGTGRLPHPGRPRPRGNARPLQRTRNGKAPRGVFRPRSIPHENPTRLPRPYGPGRWYKRRGTRYEAGSRAASQGIGRNARSARPGGRKSRCARSGSQSLERGVGGVTLRLMQPRRIRPVFRLASLMFFIACGATGVAWGVAASPFVAGNVLAARSLSAVSGGIGLVVLVACIARRRWFCRWACPVGLALQQAGSLTKSRPRLKKLRFGRWLALVSLGGAAFGLPLLLWLDPIVLFTAAFGVAGKPALLGAVAALAILAVILVASVLDRGFWCRCLCPAGGIQDLCAVWHRIAPRCKRARAESKPDRGRRTILAAVAASAVFGFGALLARSARRLTSPARLRPPGAVDEPAFAGLCSRCGNCVRTCPAGIIRPVTSGDIDILTPTVSFADGYCREDCVRCTHVCPTGALERLTLKEKPVARIGLARVDLDLCLLTYDEECNICGRACPYEAVSFVWNDETYTRAPEINPTRCNGCGACQVMCPATADDDRGLSAKAIMVEKVVSLPPPVD